MYERFFGLQERPFRLSAILPEVCLSASQLEALATLEYALSDGHSLTLLLGESGTGKTTLTQMAMQRPAAAGMALVYLDNPILDAREFFELLAHKFELSAAAAASKGRFLIELESLLEERHAAGIRTALIVDEAQTLPDEGLEQVRLLGNAGPTGGDLLAVLVGQPELAERLNRVSLRQLKQRIGLRCLVSPLSAAESVAHITARVQAAGGTVSALFTPDALELLARVSRGIPRSISMLCENALVTAFALGLRPVDRATVLAVCRDFDVAAPDARPAVRLGQARATEPATERDAGHDASTPAATKRRFFSWT